MLHPSIDDLLDIIDSKYTLVTIAAKRARELREDESLTLDRPVSKKYVGMALEEIHARNITYEHSYKRSS